MVDETMPAYTRRHWAKSDRRDSQRIHLLGHHLADVGACFEGLLRQPTIRQRLARTAGRDDLDAATVARLCVFAALHDIGKVNVGFQTRYGGAKICRAAGGLHPFNGLATSGIWFRCWTTMETPKPPAGFSPPWALRRES